MLRDFFLNLREFFIDERVSVGDDYVPQGYNTPDGTYLVDEKLYKFKNNEIILIDGKEIDKNRREDLIINDFLYVSGEIEEKGILSEEEMEEIMEEISASGDLEKTIEKLCASRE